jgi:two-component system cell cycle response regulator
MLPPPRPPASPEDYPAHLRVLVAEDEPVSRHRLQVSLSGWGYHVTCVSDGEAALVEMARPDHPSLIVLDWSMPKVDGLQVCRTVRDLITDRYVYIILVTSHDSEDSVVAGFDAGADDYVTKPFNNRELQARVRSGARIVQLQHQLIAAREQLREKAMHDPLTGLLTRGAFFEIHERELLRARRTDTPMSLIMADLDHFKQINDRYGHLAGDDVLREAARRLSATLRRSDAMGRYGGEEFIALATGCRLADALPLAERFRQSINAAPFETSAGTLRVTTSVGVASTDDVGDAARLLKAADDALYRAKAGGRNRVEVYSIAGPALRASTRTIVLDLP